MRILVAEDDAPLANLLCQQLQQEQFSVQVVSDGIAAQQLASDQSYDLVLLDLALPGAQGLHVLRAIRSKKPDLPVLIVTGANRVEERVRGLDAGADDYVSKPFDLTELPRASAPFCAGATALRDLCYRSRILSSTAWLTPCGVAAMKSH